jgi:hypothetical protein
VISTTRPRTTPATCMSSHSLRIRGSSTCATCARRLGQPGSRRCWRAQVYASRPRRRRSTTDDQQITRGCERFRGPSVGQPIWFHAVRGHAVRGIVTRWTSKGESGDQVSAALCGSQWATHPSAGWGGHAALPPPCPAPSRRSSRRRRGIRE